MDVGADRQVGFYDLQKVEEQTIDVFISPKGNLQEDFL